MPEARVAAMPPMVALAPGSTEKNRPLPRRCLLSCSRVTPACTVASRSPVLTCKIRFICERSRLTPPLRGCLKSRLRVTDHRGVMPITINTDKLYDTDLTDAAWALIGPMLPAARRGGRPRTTNIRAVRQLPMRGRRKRRQDRRRDARQTACDALARCRALFAQDPRDSDRQMR